MTGETDGYRRTKKLFLSTSIALSAIGFALTGLFYSSAPPDLLSYGFGSALAVINLLWITRLVGKFTDDGAKKNRAGIEWGVKVLVILGAIVIVTYKDVIKVLPFVFGLSILPLAVAVAGLLAGSKSTTGEA